VRIALITDAWKPQVNGVVRTLETLCLELSRIGHEVKVFEPSIFKTIPCPSYPEIRLAINSFGTLSKELVHFKPDSIHIATEGPIGFSAWRFCRKRKLPFTTAFHTQFPEYIHHRIRLPIAWSYAVLRKFHNQGAGVFVATPSVRNILYDCGFQNIIPWTRGIDVKTFYPHEKSALDYERPIQLYVGRVAIEKNLEAFLKLDTLGSKLIVGEGPAMNHLRNKYPKVHFLGKKTGDELTRIYSSSDVFVFPSLTDTFGLVMLEALACGIPVAAFPVQGPIDVITDPKAGCLDQNLKIAIETALRLNKEDCIAHSNMFSWAKCTEIFLSNLAPISLALWD